MQAWIIEYKAEVIEVKLQRVVPLWVSRYLGSNYFLCVGPLGFMLGSVLID